MVSTCNLFASFRAQLLVHLTPSDLGHHFSEHLVQLCFERAGHADAVRLTHFMMAAAICDHNELRLDMPPAVQDQLKYARLSFLQLLELAIDDNITGAMKDAVVDAVNQLGEKLSSFIEDKEAVRAEASVEKYAIVLSLPPTAARSSPVPPRPSSCGSRR